MLAATQAEIAVVSKLELTELADAEQKYSERKKKLAAAEREVKFQRLRLAEKVLGIKSEDELKALAPAQLDRRMERRLEAGQWKRGHDAPEFSFVKTHQGCYPSWAQLFIEHLGETAAARIRTETPDTYSYAVQIRP